MKAARGRSGWFAAGAAALVLALGGERAGAASDPYRDVSLALGQSLVAYFPAVQGYVVSASGGEAYVDLAQKDLVRPGMELLVYRPGADMVHPVTKQVLGTYENNLGVLHLTEVREKYSRGELDPAGAAAGILPGDRVRISARRLRTLLHFSGAASGIEVGRLAQSLLARGEESARFVMIDEPTWAAQLAELRAPWESVRADPAALRRLGALTAADLLLAVRIEPAPVPRVAVEVRSLATGSPLGELSERWPAAGPAAVPVAAAAPAPTGGVTKAPSAAAAPASPPAGLATKDPSPAPVSAPSAAAAAPSPESGEYVVRELGSAAKCLAAGDILGEGKLDVALTDGSRISLYRWEEKSLVWRWDEDGRRGRRVVSLDAADLDGDGRAELLVVQVTQGRVTSEMRRWRDGTLQVATVAEGVYLRVVSWPGAAPLLFGQRAGMSEVLAGRVEQYRLAGDSFEPVGGTALPKGTGIFGLALGPAASDVAHYALDQEGYLTAITADGRTLWRSSRPYGGYPPPLRSGELFGPGATSEETYDERFRVFQGRLLAEAASGGVRIFVPRNYSDFGVLLVQQRAMGRGEVVLFEGPAGAPEEVARSRAFDGYVADAARADVDGDGNPELLFVVTRYAGPLLGERGKLVAWRPPGTPARPQQSP